MYQHHNWQGALLDYPVSKVVCVGSNYAKHIKEMGSATPEEPVLFIKPETALCDLRQPLVLPEGAGLGASRSRAGGAYRAARCVRRRKSMC